MSEETIGSLSDILGLRDPIPFYALHVGASLSRGNDSMMTVVFQLRDGVVRRLISLSMDNRVLLRVPLILGKSKYILKNVIFSSVAWSGKVSFYFDYAKELDPVIQGSRNGVYDRYGWAGPLSTYGEGHG